MVAALVCTELIFENSSQPSTLASGAISESGLALTLYPPSASYRRLVETNFGGGLEWVCLGPLRRAGWIRILSHLRGNLFRPVVLAMETPDTERAAGVLGCFAALHLPPTIDQVDGQGRANRLSLLSVLGSASELLTASLAGQAARWSNRRGLRQVTKRRPVRRAFLSGKQRILYLKTNQWFGVRAGGSVGHTAGLLDALDTAGHSLCFVSPETPPGTKAVLDQHTFRLRPALSFPAETNLFRTQAACVRAALAAARLFRPSMIYQRLSLGDWTGVEVAHALGLPLVVEYNGSESWVSRHWGQGVRYRAEMEAAENAMLKHADLVFTISEVLHGELLARGVPAGRAAWYPNGVDPHKFDPHGPAALEGTKLRAQWGIRPDEVVVVFLGTFGRWHGAEVLAQAAKEIRCSSLGGRVRLVFVGDGLTRELCEKTVRGTPAEADCVFTGILAQELAPACLAAADICICPHVPNADGSDFFGSPTKLFEYMSMARPVVASRLGQIGKILEDGVDGLLVPPANPVFLADAIQSLAADPGLRRRLGEAARQKIIRQHTWDRHAEEIFRAIRRLGNSVEKGSD